MTPMHPRRFFPLRRVTKAPQCWRKASPGSGTLGISAKFRYPTKASRAMRRRVCWSVSVSGNILLFRLFLVSLNHHHAAGGATLYSFIQTFPEIPEVLHGGSHGKQHDHP